MKYQDPGEDVDRIVFWAITVAIFSLILWSILSAQTERGTMGNPCMPDATCKHHLVCRESRERGDWRCMPPLDVP